MIVAKFPPYFTATYFCADSGFPHVVLTSTVAKTNLRLSNNPNNSNYSSSGWSLSRKNSPRLAASIPCPNYTQNLASCRTMSMVCSPRRQQEAGLDPLGTLYHPKPDK